MPDNDSLSSKLKMAEDAMPDRYTLAWWKQQWAEVQKGYRGATHASNRCHADYVNIEKRQEGVEERCDTIEKRQDGTDAKVGEGLARVSVLEERLDKAGVKFKELEAKLNGK